MVTLRPFTVTDPAPGRTCEKTAIAAPLGEVLAITTLDRAGLRRMRDTSKATAGIQANRRLSLAARRGGRAGGVGVHRAAAA